ncbi:MAG: hypothetical protein QXX87_04830 [Candidatus Jordarchaeales archaeon]
MLVAILVASVLSLVLLQVLLVPQPVLAITGEQPAYTVGDTWRYNMTITVTSNNTTTSTPLTYSIVGTQNVITFNGTPKDCYVFRHQPALDPSTFFLLYLLCSDLFAGNVSVTEFVEILKNSSYSEFYLTKSNNELVGIHIYFYYLDESNNAGIDLNATLLFEEAYPYLLKFPLTVNSTFGNYTNELNCTFQGYLYVYNGSWNNMTPSSTISLSTDFLFLLFPPLNVTGVEEVTVSAGTFECWKIEYTECPGVLTVWYSPEVKNIAKLGLSIEGELIYTADLQDYSLVFTTPEQQMLIFLYFLQQSSQQLKLFIAAGGLAVALAAATTAFLAWKKRA